MTKVSHGPLHYKEQRARASDAELIVKHVRICPEDKELVEELVRPFKEKADAQFRRVRREQKAAERAAQKAAEKRTTEERRLAEAAALPPSLEVPPEAGEPSLAVQTIQTMADESDHSADPRNSTGSRTIFHHIPKRRPTLTLGYRRAG